MKLLRRESVAIEGQSVISCSFKLPQKKLGDGRFAAGVVETGGSVVVAHVRVAPVPKEQKDQRSLSRVHGQMQRGVPAKERSLLRVRPHFQQLL